MEEEEKEEKENPLERKRIGIEERLTVEDLSEPRFDNSPLLQELEIGEVAGVPLYTYPQADFRLNPDLALGRRLDSIMKASSKAEVFLRLGLIAGSTPALWSLLTKGISTGLSNGTMDIIYRVDVPSKVNGLLDNVFIAVGCAQRRIVVSNVLAELIAGNKFKGVISVAGGSCIIPIEAIYQVGAYGLQIVSVDYSSKAHERADLIRKKGKAHRDLGIEMQFFCSDIVNDGIPEAIRSSEPQLFECTGFWEYLNPADRDRFLERIAESLKESDIFVLTALVNNPQQPLFEKMGFKQLNPQGIEEFIEQIKRAGLVVRRVYVTPNGAYATAVISC